MIKKVLNNDHNELIHQLLTDGQSVERIASQLNHLGYHSETGKPLTGDDIQARVNLDAVAEEFAGKNAKKPQIFELMSRVMASIDPISKDRKNEHFNYKFRGIDDVMNSLHPALTKYGVFYIPEILSSEDSTIQRSKGPAIRVKVKIKYTFYAPDGSWVASVVSGEGVDNEDKASNKAMSAALKYMLLQVFCIPTEDLEDADAAAAVHGQPKQAQAKKPDPAKQAQAKAAQAKTTAPKPDPDKPTPAQLTSLSAMIKKSAKLGWTNDSALKFSKMAFGVNSAKDLSLDQFNQLVYAIENLPAAQAIQTAGVPDDHSDFMNLPDPDFGPN